MTIALANVVIGMAVTWVAVLLGEAISARTSEGGGLRTLAYVVPFWIGLLAQWAP